MFDLETWGTVPGCALRSVGAVAFDRESNVLGDSFYMNVTLESCLHHGLTQDEETVVWWSQRSVEAQARLLEDQQHLDHVASEFHRWFVRQCVGPSVVRVQEMRLWCHGATFDDPVWQAAIRKLGLRAPWHYAGVRDTRTLYDIAELNLDDVPREGVHHDALDDARHQARCVQAAFRKLEITRQMMEGD